MMKSTCQKEMPVFTGNTVTLPRMKRIQLLRQKAEEYRLHLQSAYPDRTQPLPHESRFLSCTLQTETLTLYFGGDVRSEHLSLIHI